MKLKFALALCATALSSGVASAASTYNFVVAPILGSNGQPLPDDNKAVDGRTFYFTIGATETPTAYYSSLFKYPNYFVKSYSYTEFGSTTMVTVPATTGKNVEFFNYTNQGGLFLTNSGVRNFHLFGDTVGGDQSEVLYDDAAYQLALQSDPSAQPIFKLGTFTLSTYPRNGSAIQPIQNYTVTISLAGAVGAVPEPASWAMMVAGLGIAGAALRRRKGARIAAA